MGHTNFGLMAPVSMINPYSADGAPGPSRLGTGGVAAPIPAFNDRSSKTSIEG